LIVDTDLRELKCVTDKSKVRQLLINFLSNAYKFTPFDGKIDVTLRKSKDRKFFVIEVTDS
jgi:signal transduction histidine kinase